MRRNINDQPIKRKFIFDKTIDLIKNSKLVIAITLYHCNGLYYLKNQ